MLRKILFKAGAVALEAELNGSQTSKFLWERLPLGGDAELYGGEVYFYFAACTSSEEGFSRDVVEVGTVAYWPEGPCLCIFFGPTPSSRDGDIRPASAVTVIGKVVGDATLFKDVQQGEKIEVIKA